MAQTMTFNGVELTMEELNAKMAELKALQGLQKEAKKAGLITASKEVAAKKAKSANFTLVLAQFSPVVETNRTLIADLFKEFAGQDSISFDADKEYQVIIRSKAIVAEKKAKRDAEAKEKFEMEKAETRAKLSADDLKKVLDAMSEDQKKVAAEYDAKYAAKVAEEAAKTAEGTNTETK